jgi:hypothetical protein
MTASQSVLSHTNRMGVTFYLHRGKTKTGKDKYFVAKAIREGALDEMPAGYEFAESINGVVSVRRVDQASTIPEADVEVVRTELARHEHLRFHRVEKRKDSIVVHEPVGDFGDRTAEKFAQASLVPVALVKQIFERQRATARFTPVMKFVAAKDGPYIAYRMRYSGMGGWYLLTSGSIEELSRQLIGAVGTDRFFELY